MKSGLKMQELVKQMEEFVAKVQSGQVSQEELDAFVEVTAALHQKAVILRYKSFENQVFGRNQALNFEDKPVPAEVKTEEVQHSVASGENNESETVVESQQDPEQFINAEVELTHSHIEDEPTFDLFSLDVDSVQEDVAEADRTVADEGQNAAIEMEIEQAAEAIEPAAIPDPEETAPAAEKLPETTAEPVRLEDTTPLHAIYQRIDRPDDSFASRFPVNKIETLNVAFGFNERLQTINDLFGGSSEVFNAAVREIEQAPSKNEARKIVTRYAHQQNWNSSDDLAVNFAKKVDQLYA